MAFSRSVGSQSPNFGMRVVAVNPGYTATDRAESVLRKIAENNSGRPSDGATSSANWTFPSGEWASRAKSQTS
jgi:hypothetical protein